ncbi:Peptidase M16 inactive domain protein [Pseudoruegeria aquimaris]|uniref:Peptidase M16 inactive domain protein n=1 Tax=Pseudoruegeria aquimaris TaxID=393663 RepID=A0A1Y5TGI6_9RHOB|nr:pitrilysin family protein [Pseudoruegeria aquimaris]SLN63353.1 Peptidase M16 inactive domain protein [Pseudoruegeria aquimaris]
MMMRMIRSALAAATLLALPALPALAAVEIQEVKSEGGFTAWLVEEHTIPFVALELRFKGGANLDPEGKRGAINLMTGLLEEGAGDLDARGFAEAREALAASYDFDVYDDTLTISAQFLTENRAEAVALLRKALVETRFDQDAIDRVRAQVVSIIQSDEKDPNAIAARTFDALAFGDHPYATPRDGTLESIAALTREDMFEARDRVIAKDRVYVGAVGDITPEQLSELMDALLSDLPETGAPPVPDAEYALEGGVTVVPFPSPQSVVIFGHEGIKRDDEDFFAAYVMNQILGAGGFSSRLMEEVREKRGLTYGISTFLVPMDHAETVQGQVASSNETVAEAIEVIRAEWRRMAEEGVTEEELRDAKTYLTGAYPLRFDGNGTIANIIVGMQTQGLPIDYIATRNDKVEAVTREDVARVAKRLLDADALHFVVVGQPEGLETTN